MMSGTYKYLHELSHFTAEKRARGGEDKFSEAKLHLLSCISVKHCKEKSKCSSNPSLPHYSQTFLYVIKLSQLLHVTVTLNQGQGQLDRI